MPILTSSKNNAVTAALPDERPPTFRIGEDVSQDTSRPVGTLMEQAALIEAMHGDWPWSLLLRCVAREEGGLLWRNPESQFLKKYGSRGQRSVRIPRQKIQGLARDRNLLTLYNLIFLLSYVKMDILRDDSLDGCFEIAWLIRVHWGARNVAICSTAINYPSINITTLAMLNTIK